MSQLQQELKVQTQDDNGGDAAIEQEQLVPVSEAIKYRRRAQAAEQELEQISQELHDIRRRQELTEQESQITQQLIKAGVDDFEVALLLVKSKIMQDGDKALDTNAYIDTLRKERPALFRDNENVGSEYTLGTTAGVRGKSNNSRGLLSRLAKQASYSGSTRDIGEYLKMRRSMGIK